MQVTHETYNELVELVTPFVKTEADRRVFVQHEITTKTIKTQLDLSKEPQDFAEQLVKEYRDAGVLDSGEIPLIALLEVLLRRADKTLHNRIERLIKRIRGEAVANGEAPTPEFTVDIKHAMPGDYWVGRKVATYLFGNKIGEGGFGLVFHARDTRTDNEVAVKLLPADRMKTSGMLERFEREAEIMGRLKHKHIIQLIDYWLDNDGNAFLVMPWMAHGDLRNRIRRQGAIPLTEVEPMFEQLCDALHIAHETNIVHRDIKPDNIFFDGNDNAVLGDFGIAIDTWAHANLTEPGIGIGTLSYGAPEQLIGDTHRDKPQVDIYAMGITLYESVTGQYPFPGETGKHLYLNLPNLHTKFDHLPAGLDEVIQMATRKQREDRYQTIKEFWQDLEQALKGMFPTALSQPDPNDDEDIGNTTIIHDIQIVRFIRSANDLSADEDPFAGRENMLEEIFDGLDKQGRVLLHGMGGVGKTAIAREVVKQRADQSILWVHVGHSSLDMLNKAMLKALGHEDNLQLALIAAGISMLVLDDIWVDGSVIRQLLAMLMPNVKVLATSRTRLPIGKIVDVDVVDEPDALAILGAYAYTDYTSDENAKVLVKLLGYHPYALEIAAKNMLVDSLSPAELVKQIRNAPHNMTYPENFVVDGRSSVAALLETSVEHLEPDVRKTFFGYGALFVPGVTAEFLGYLMELDEPTTTEHLMQLHRRGLVKKQPDDPVYRIHDLTFSYAQENTSVNSFATLEVANIYVVQNKSDLAKLDLERNNILGAMEYADEQGISPAVVQMAYDLAVDAEVPYFLAGGYTDRVINIMERAAEAAKLTDNRMVAHRLLGKIGDAYAIFRGDYDRAIPIYRESLLLAQAMGDSNRIAIMSALIGTTLANKGGQTEEAIGFYERAEEIARVKQDNKALMKVLEQRGLFFAYREDFATARDRFAEMLDVAEESDDLFDRFYALLNLSAAEVMLANYPIAFEHAQRLHRIAQEQNSPVWIAYAEQALGEVQHFIGNAAQAKQHLTTAGEMFVKLGEEESLREVKEKAEEFGYDIDFQS